MIEFLLLLFMKHYIVDFIMQNDDMIRGKGIYGNRYGILHSLQHGIGTAIAAIATMANPWNWLVLSLIDFIAHYHIDYIKMRFGEKDISKPLFWHHLGLDQLAHYITYLILVAYVL